MSQVSVDRFDVVLHLCIEGDQSTGRSLDRLLADLDADVAVQHLDGAQGLALNFPDVYAPPTVSSKTAKMLAKLNKKMSGQP